MVATDSGFSLKGVKPGKQKNSYPYRRLLVRKETADLLRKLAQVERRNMITVLAELVEREYRQKVPLA